MGSRTFPNVISALLVVNRPSGQGRSASDIEQLTRSFHTHFSSIPNRAVAVTDGHAEVTCQVKRFLYAARGPALLVAGGGGGTTRALVQGLMECVAAGLIDLDRVYISCLRLGSGNVVARHFGVPREPEAALRRIAHNLAEGRVAPCTVFACACGQSDAIEACLYGLTLGLFGPFARIPRDVQRWKEHRPRLTRWAARLISLEKLTLTQYALAGMWRAAQCLFQPWRAEPIEVRAGDGREQLRLLAGLLLNFDFPALPVHSSCAAGERKLALDLFPYEGRRRTVSALLQRRRLAQRVHRHWITPTTPVEIRFLESHSAVVALDEDLFIVPGRLGLEVAGCVRFVPGN